MIGCSQSCTDIPSSTVLPLFSCSIYSCWMVSTDLAMIEIIDPPVHHLPFIQYSVHNASHPDTLSSAGKHTLSFIFPTPSNAHQKPQSAASVSWQPDPFYGHEPISRLCAKFVTHLFACPCPILSRTFSVGRNYTLGHFCGPRPHSMTRRVFLWPRAISRLCAKFVTHLFACPELQPSPSVLTVRLPYFITYALHLMKLHSLVVLVFLQRLQVRFPTAWRSSGHCLFVSAFMLAKQNVDLASVLLVRTIAISQHLLSFIPRPGDIYLGININLRGGGRHQTRVGQGQASSAGATRDGPASPHLWPPATKRCRPPQTISMITQSRCRLPHLQPRHKVDDTADVDSMPGRQPRV